MASQPTNDLPELSSLASGLEDLLGRIDAMGARRIKLDPDDQLANELFEIDRLLSSANRRLIRLLRGQQR